MAANDWSLHDSPLPLQGFEDPAVEAEFSWLLGLGHFPTGGASAVDISGAILEGSDSAAGALNHQVSLSGAILEGSDAVAGTVSVVVSISGAITEGSDAVAGTLAVVVSVSGAVAEGSDSTDGTVEMSESSEPEPVTSVVRTYWAGFIPPRKKRARQEDAPVVEIAVEKKVVKYVSVRTPLVIPSVAPIMESIEVVTRMIDARAKAVEIQRKILEVEEEENIIIILSQLH